MGWFALFNRPDGPGFAQLIATTFKVPLLFALTLVVTFPSLYVFNALVGSRLRLVAMLELLIAAMSVTMAVLASFGPITAFFAVTTTSYHFISLLNVLILSLAGVLGLKFLLQTLHRLTVAAEPFTGETTAVDERSNDADSSTTHPPDDAADGEPDSDSESDDDSSPPKPPSALDTIKGHVLGYHVKLVFNCWVIVFALVGGQMAWVLRPFIGDPNRPFSLFRERESNFFEAVYKTIIELLS